MTTTKIQKLNVGKDGCYHTTIPMGIIRLFGFGKGDTIEWNVDVNTITIRRLK